METLNRQVWCGGQILAFSGIDGATDHGQGLTARTAFGAPGLEVKLPGMCLIRFGEAANVEHWITGDAFEVAAPKGRVRGAFLDAHHLLIDGPCEVGPIDGPLVCHAQSARVLVGAAAHFDGGRIEADLDATLGARTEWLRRQPCPASVSPAARRTFSKMLSIMKTQVYSPEGNIRHPWTTPDRWPHRHMWLWDSAFHAVGWRHVAPSLAKEMLAAVLDTQREDGFVAHMMTPRERSSITQPPVLALGVKLVHEAAPDREWIAALYPRLCAYVEWDFANRDSDGAGLAEWSIEGDPRCRSGESGMDNSPRFDAATKLDAVDFNAFLALECETLAGFAAELGWDEDARRWMDRHQRLCGLIRERLWSEELHFFVDYDVEAGVPSPVLASSGFLPLICGAATVRQAEHLATHLRSPDSFGTLLPVPSVAVSCAAHYAKDMWRGPTWINLNWLIARGFERYGMGELAARIRVRSCAAIEEACEQFGVAFEYYDDRGEVPPPQLLRKGRCAPENSPYHQVVHDYGWTAALYVDWVLEGQ